MPYVSHCYPEPSCLITRARLQSVVVHLHAAGQSDGTITSGREQDAHEAYYQAATRLERPVGINFQSQ